MNPFVNIALAFLGALLSKAANLVWDDIWAKLYELIAQAETLYYSEAGLKRKDWVIEQSLIWLDEKLKPSGIQRFILKFALTSLVDALVKSLNDTIGHNWVDKAKEIETRLAGTLPVIA